MNTSRGLDWWAWQGLNLRPLRCQRRAVSQKPQISAVFSRRSARTGVEHPGISAHFYRKVTAPKATPAPAGTGDEGLTATMRNHRMAKPTIQHAPRYTQGEMNAYLRGIEHGIDAALAARRPEARIDRRLPETATIYFIGAEDGPIKIGFAVDVQSRLRTLQSQSPAKLQLLAHVIGDPRIERQYHKRFAASRLHGEWFERTPELLAEIARLTAKDLAA